jgi:hypothetical protein
MKYRSAWWLGQANHGGLSDFLGSGPIPKFWRSDIDSLEELELKSE